MSALEAYFEGKRELFHGLAIGSLEPEWISHAVLHFDLNAGRYDSRERFYDMLEFQLRRWEEIYGVTGNGLTHATRFMEMIRSAYEKTGRA